MSEQTGAPTMTLWETAQILRGNVLHKRWVEAGNALRWYAALIDRLPKDAEGVPVVLGKTYYTRSVWPDGAVTIAEGVAVVAWENEDDEESPYIWNWNAAHRTAEAAAKGAK